MDKPWEDGQWLYDRYWVDEMSLREIGAIVECSTNTIHRQMNKYEIRTRTKKELWRSKKHREKMGGKSYGYHRYWTKEELINLESMYVNPDLSVGDIAINLERTIKSIEGKAGELKLRRPPEVRAKASADNLRRWWSITYANLSEEEKKELNKYKPGRDISGPNNPMYGRSRKDLMTPEAYQDMYRRIAESNRGKLHPSVQGERNTNWKGGASFKPYPPEFSTRLKQAIRKRDGHLCQRCGKSGNQAHHINGVKEDSRSVNLITLCPSCHRYVEYHCPVTWARLLRAIARHNEQGYAYPNWAPLERIHLRGSTESIEFPYYFFAQ